MQKKWNLLNPKVEYMSNLVSTAFNFFHKSNILLQLKLRNWLYQLILIQ